MCQQKGTVHTSAADNNTIRKQHKEHKLHSVTIQETLEPASKTMPQEEKYSSPLHIVCDGPKP